MLKPLIVVVVIGTAIGLMVPSRPSSAPAAPASPAATPAPGEPVRLQRQEDGHFYVHADVDGQLARFLVDTGASYVALSERDAARLGVEFSRAKYRVVGTGASGPVRGQEVMLGKVTVEGREVTEVRGVVLEGLELSLLGQSYLSRVGSIEMSGDTMVLN
jgi:aspartyl protease family protein